MWTPMDLDILQTLCGKVRVLSASQLARGWPEAERLSVSLAQLTQAELVVCEQWQVVLPRIHEQPSVTWKPGQAAPDAWRLSTSFRQRWNREASSIVVYRATEQAGRLFGSRSGHPIRESERRHDLLLSEVYLLYRERLSALAEAWIGEDALPLAPRHVKNPDAFLFDSALRPRRVIESAGSYSQRQVETFHRYCVEARLPYELW